MEFKLQGSSHFSRVITQQLSALTLDFFSSVCCCDILYIYIWFNYVTFEHLLVICLSMLVEANWTCRKQRSRWFVISFYFYIYETNFSIDTIWVYGSLRPIWLFITFLAWFLKIFPTIQNILYKTLLEKLKNNSSKIIFIQSLTFWLLTCWAIGYSFKVATLVLILKPAKFSGYTEIKSVWIQFKHQSILLPFMNGLFVFPACWFPQIITFVVAAHVCNLCVFWVDILHVLKVNLLRYNIEN